MTKIHEDLADLVVIAERRKDKTIPHKDFLAKLKKDILQKTDHVFKIIPRRILKIKLVRESKAVAHVSWEVLSQMERIVI